MKIESGLIEKCIESKASLSRETVVKFLSQNQTGPNDTYKFITSLCHAGYYYDEKDKMYKNIEKTRRKT